jgi:hypothetical protein
MRVVGEEQIQCLASTASRQSLGNKMGEDTANRTLDRNWDKLITPLPAGRSAS